MFTWMPLPLILVMLPSQTNADVMLRSRDGGLNFGPMPARTVGDVNFIENVKHLSISETALDRERL